MSALPQHDISAMGVIDLAHLISACDGSLASFTAHLDRSNAAPGSQLSETIAREVENTTFLKQKALRHLQKSTPQNRHEALERLRVLAIIELQVTRDTGRLFDVAKAEINRAFDMASLQICAIDQQEEAGL